MVGSGLSVKRGGGGRAETRASHWLLSMLPMTIDSATSRPAGLSNTDRAGERTSRRTQTL